MNEILSECLKVALIAVIPALLALVASAFGWLRAWVESHTRNVWLQIIEREAFSVVAAVGQVMIDPIKRAAADGKLSEEEKANLKATAMNALEIRLRSLPKDLFPDLANRLSQSIETAVSQTKSPLPSSPVSVLPSGQK